MSDYATADNKWVCRITKRLVCYYLQRHQLSMKPWIANRKTTKGIERMNLVNESIKSESVNAKLFICLFRKKIGCIFFKRWIALNTKSIDAR